MPRGIATARELSLGIGCRALVRLAGGSQPAEAEVEIIATPDSAMARWTLLCGPWRASESVGSRCRVCGRCRNREAP
jgi:hypothetical protein